ncbi:DUF4406 domain-containing protein [Pseudaeromonas pectinilytica]
MTVNTHEKGAKVRAQLIHHATEYKQIALDGRKVYIAGPMTGLPEMNRPAFSAAAEYLEGLGAKVMNPAILPDGWEHHQYMRIAIPMMMECEVVAFLPGWQDSKGARVEFTRSRAFALVQVALDLGTPVDGLPVVRSHRALMV